MELRRMSISILILTLLIGIFGGCILDEENNGRDSAAVESIDELTIGGGVFLVPDLEYGYAQIGTFHGIDPFIDSEVYVNGIKLSAQGGFYSNTQPIAINDLMSGPTLRISVYALGDSVIKDLVIPEKPEIIKPSNGAILKVGEDMALEINYPGEHQFVAFTLSNQEDVASGTNEAVSKLEMTVEGQYLPNAGESLLSAYTVNTSGDIPDENDFELENQFKIFLVANITLSAIIFTP